MLFVLEGMLVSQLRALPTIAAKFVAHSPASWRSPCSPGQHLYGAALTLGSAHIINQIRLESFTSCPVSTFNILDLKANKQRARLTLSRQVVNIPRNIYLIWKMQRHLKNPFKKNNSHILFSTFKILALLTGCFVVSSLIATIPSENQ